MKELDKILDENEKVFWEGKPNFWPFFFSGLEIVFFGSIFIVTGAIIFFKAISEGNILFLLFPHFWVGVVIVFGIPLYKILVHKHLYYAITNKRVLLQRGLIGRDFEIVDFDQITNADVNVNLFDKLFGGSSGSIRISTAGSFTYGRNGNQISRPYTLSNVSNPYEVFKFFKKVSHAVKTDIHFPNKYRPSDNPGYDTKFNPKK